MITTTTRTRGVTLHLLDLSSVGEKAKEWLDERKPDHPWNRLEPGFAPYAYAEHNGHLYVVCNEGVGWEVTDQAPLVVDNFGKGDTSFSVFPVVSTALSPEEVKALDTGEEIDLADLIRTFGARLEDNFWTWHQTLTEGAT